jgi:hypothetical protein
MVRTVSFAALSLALAPPAFAEALRVDPARRRALAHEDAREAEQRSAVPAHETGERGAVSGLNHPDQLGIVEPRCTTLGGIACVCRAQHRTRPMFSVVPAIATRKRQNVMARSEAHRLKVPSGGARPPARSRRASVSLMRDRPTTTPDITEPRSI